MACHGDHCRSQRLHRRVAAVTVNTGTSADSSPMDTSFGLPSQVKRSPDDTTTSSSRPSKSCGPDDTTGICTRPVNGTTTMTLPIVLGILIPLTCAAIVFFLLHRRHVKKLRLEDANDKHKSLDFGLDPVPSGSSDRYPPNGGSGLTIGEKGVKGNGHGHGHGVSMDMALNSPYLLPPGLHGSRESIHSLSRTIHGEDDKYRPATAINYGENSSVRSFSPHAKRVKDDSSSHSDSGSKYAHGGDEMNQNLLQNAQRMSRSPPVQSEAFENDIGHAPPHAARMSPNGPQKESSPSGLTVPTSGGNLGDRNSTASSVQDVSALRKSNNYLGALIQRGDTTYPEHERNIAAPTTQTNILPDEPQIQENKTGLAPMPAILIDEPKPGPSATTAPPRISLPADDDKSDYGDEPEPLKSHVPQLNIEPAKKAPSTDDKTTIPTLDTYDQYYDESYQVDTRRLTMGLRPLPPEDPSDNPEQRANRIRSFYKEYFDETKPQEDYYEDYGPGNEDFAFDPYADRGYFGHQAPFAQPEGRRAMTPPPRMPANAGQFRPRGPGFGPPSNGSRSGSPFSTGPRAFSSASNRMPANGRKKPLPAPTPLHILPTPHKLKDDNILPIDFAPGTSSRDRQQGRPGTPQGGLKPYTLNVPAHVPLASSYDDLALLPSPHALRKSGAFTALDFVPPSRFKNSDSGSDAGSIRSNRTGISAAQQYSIRTGAYRISRLPPQTVGTKDDIISNLRPTWDMKH